MKKLWTNDKKLDSFIESFETRADLHWDQKLVKYDLIASMVHAKMLHKIGILTADELKKLIQGLTEILNLNEQNQFKLLLGDEDMHTKIENYLTEKYGEVGQKIHTGRSRNDQVLTALRLYSKDHLEQVQQQLQILIGSFKSYAKKYGSIQMSGYTHMQKAMPSSIKLWAGSFVESLQDDLEVLKNAAKINNQSPLGSAAGYGTPLNLDRAYTAKLLGFAKVQENTLYAQNSKGKIEAVILSSFIQTLLSINKFASDVMLFTTQEFKFFQSSAAITTGSSIMPQKKNLDIAELLRSKVHLLLGSFTKVVSLSSNLISGYNRDLQDAKKPLIESFEITLDSIKVANILLNNLTPNKQALEASLTEEIFTAHKAFEQVKKGVPFRKAYLKLKKKK